MTLPTSLIAALLASVLASSVWTARVEAQSPTPVSLVVPHALVMAESPTPPFSLPPPRADVVTWKRQRRSLAMIAVGAGLIASAAVHLSYMRRAWTCNGEPTKPLISPYVGGVVGSIGLGLTIGGAVRLSTIPRERRRAISVGRGFVLAGIGFGAALASQSLMLLAAMPEIVCST